jgi:hypothetical protein
MHKRHRTKLPSTLQRIEWPPSKILITKVDIPIHFEGDTGTLPWYRNLLRILIQYRDRVLSRQNRSGPTPSDSGFICQHADVNVAILSDSKPTEWAPAAMVTNSDSDSMTNFKINERSSVAER